MRWSVSRFCGELYVRIFSLRSPDFTMALRSLARASCCFSISISYRRARSTRMPFSRFLICDFSSWQLTTVLVGMCVMRTAEYVVFTDCPPGPEEQNVSMRRSLASILISTSSASGSTATVTAEVCTRPCCSVAGTRCTRCTPLSFDDGNDLFQAADRGFRGRKHFHLPALRFGIAGVHAEHFVGEERRLV